MIGSCSWEIEPKMTKYRGFSNISLKKLSLVFVENNLLKQHKTIVYSTTPCLEKYLLLKYNQKSSQPIKLQLFFKNSIFRSNVLIEDE